MHLGKKVCPPRVSIYLLLRIDVNNTHAEHVIAKILQVVFICHGIKAQDI